MLTTQKNLLKPLLKGGVCVCVCMSHLADLVKGVLSISSSVFEVVMSWECPVNVSGDGTILRGLLAVKPRRGHKGKGQHV